MENKKRRFHIGLRTIKTVAAVIIAMIVVESYGATSSKLIFAMLGAMAAVQPTFKESVESCLTQIVGVLFGAFVGVLLLFLPISHLAATGIGIVLVITLYNALGIRFSPSLPCFVVVLLCITPDIQPFSYALGRIWDTAIGLAIGMIINTLIFPYDNRRQIRFTMDSLDRELILFLEDMFDGDELLPDADKLTGKIDDIEQQLRIFANQRLLMRPRRYREELNAFRLYELRARRLVAHMEVLSRMGVPGALNDENRIQLELCGASVRDGRTASEEEVRDIITNYHVAQILSLREKLLESVSGQPGAGALRRWIEKRRG